MTCTVRVSGGRQNKQGLPRCVFVCVGWGMGGNGLWLCEQELLGTSSYDFILSHTVREKGMCAHCFIVEKYHCCSITVNT